jgi:hypothetical protein
MDHHSASHNHGNSQGHSRTPSSSAQKNLQPGDEERDDKTRGATIQHHTPTLEQVKSLDYMFYATGVVAVHQLLKVSSFLFLPVHEKLTILIVLTCSAWTNYMPLLGNSVGRSN